MSKDYSDVTRILVTDPNQLRLRTGPERRGQAPSGAASLRSAGMYSRMPRR